MATFTKLEDMQIWVKARMIAKKVYDLTNDEVFNKDFSLRNQMRSAAVSIVSNIAEGYERETHKEFIRFLYISKGSAGELKTQIIIATDCEYFSEQNSQTIIEELTELAAQISRLISYLKKQLNHNREKETRNQQPANK
ncbi:MAG: four helix bundle protein [Bacteroidia bacterium]